MGSESNSPSYYNKHGVKKMSICPACKFEVPDNANVCGHCGRELYRYDGYDTSFSGRLWAGVKGAFGGIIISTIILGVSASIERGEPMSMMGMIPFIVSLIIPFYFMFKGFKKGNKTKYISYD